MLEVFGAELRRSWINFKRYPGESIGGIITVTIVFYGLFLGAKYIAGPSTGFGDRLEAIVVGYVCWAMVLFVYGVLSWELSWEAQVGTLEQVFLSPFGAIPIFTLRLISALLIQVFMNTGILLLITWITSSNLNFSIHVIPPMITVILAAFGVSFLMGSLALLLKRVNELVNVSQFVLLFLVMTPVETWSEPLKSIGYLFPFTPGVGMLRDLMARDAAFDWNQLALATVNGLGYFALGAMVFSYAVRQAKQRGLLSGY